MNQMMKRTYIFLALSLVALTIPANAAVISLSILSTPTVGSSFSVAVRAANVFGAPHVADALVAYGFDVFVTGGSDVPKFNGWRFVYGYFRFLRAGITSSCSGCHSWIFGGS